MVQASAIYAYRRARAQIVALPRVSIATSATTLSGVRCDFLFFDNASIIYF